MTRDQYKVALLKKGFLFEKTQMGFPGRGQEDVYRYPGYKYKFYVTRLRKSDESLYGFYTGDRNGRYLDDICPRNMVDDFRNDKSLKMWAGEAFVALMKNL